MTRSCAAATAVLVSVLTAGSAAVLGGPAGPAVAEGPTAQARAWETVGSGDGARYQACKSPEGEAWRVFARVDNRRSDIAHRGILRNAAGTTRTFRAAPGRVSPVKSVRAARGSSVDYVLAAAQSGGGGSVRLAELRRC